jgi:hypothetical protein
MKRKLISCASYLDETYIWCYDEVICALSRIHIKTFQVECIIPPTQILVDEDYEVRKIIGWNNKIIILPVHINKKWIVYDKLSEGVECFNFCTDSYRYSEAILFGDRVVLLPNSINNPIIVADLLEKKIVKRINIPTSEIIVKDGMEIWDAKVEGNNIYFLIRNSFFYGKLNENGIELVRINVPKNLFCADFYEDKGWAVDIEGKYLYKFNKKGVLLENYYLENRVQISRIVVEKKYIFLLPMDGSEIRIIGVNGQLVKKIALGEQNIALEFWKIFKLPAYWGYIKNSFEIWILPLKYPMKIIDMNTLKSKKKNFEYTETFSENMYWKYYEYSMRRKMNFTFYENSSNIFLKRYIEVIEGNNLEINKKEKFKDAKKIWKAIRS